ASARRTRLRVRRDRSRRSRAEKGAKESFARLWKRTSLNETIDGGARQQALFEPTHLAAVALVVIADQMQQAVEREHSQLGRKRMLSVASLSRGHADAQTLLTFTHGAVRPAHHVLSPPALSLSNGPALSLSKRSKDARCRS